MADIFISYKREDRQLVRPLVRTLQERGFTVWWDSRIETGENWMTCIKRALDAAGCVVVLWTPQSVGSDGIYLSEVVTAEAEQGRRKNILLPVRMQNGPRPWLHELRNEEDLSNWQSNVDDPALDRLAGRIATFCGARTPPESSELTAWLRAEEANNADAYRQFVHTFPHSRFSQEAEPRAAEIEQRVADLQFSITAATNIIEQFANEMGKPTFTLPISFALIGRASPGVTTRDDLFDRLRQGLKAVLHAEPGGGKTTTLLEWAREYSSSDYERVGVYIRLKELSNTGDDLIEHVARLDARGHVSEGAWKALARSGILTLFCDGWNELSDAERATVGTILDIYSRNHPSSGLMIGSRPLAPAPFKCNFLLLSLQKLSSSQVRTIIEQRIGTRASRALAELRQSKPLQELVRTPFFLAAFCETRLVDAMPTTREGLIRGMIAASEQLPQHAEPLRENLRMQHSKYLRALSVGMLQKQQTELNNDDARRVVNRQSKMLLEEDLLSEMPDASVVLETLRDHHLLLEHSGADPSFRFQHQLISEWYASEEVSQAALRALTGEDARRRLDQEIIDRPEWTEAILLSVERTQHDARSIAAVSYLILRAIGINPGFAADLIAVAPPQVWREIRPTVHAFVEAWRPVAKHRVVQFFLRCGKEEFSEEIWAVMAAEPSGDVADALDSSDFPYPLILGQDWKAKCATLSAKGREQLLPMLASSGLEGAAMAVEAAIASKEPQVQAQVAGMLAFYGFGEELTELLDTSPSEMWEELVLAREIDGLWEEPWRDRAMAAAHRVFARLKPGLQRLDFALRLRSLGEKVELDLVSEVVGMDFKDYHGEDNFLARIAEIDGERLSLALLEKVFADQRVPYRTSKYIRHDVPVSQERLMEACRTKGSYRHHDILSPLLDRNSLATLFLANLRVYVEQREAKGKERSALGEKHNDLQDALTRADKNRLAEVILAWTPGSAFEIAEAADVLARTNRKDVNDERAPLRPELRDQIVQRLIEWSSILANDATCKRYVLSSLAEAMAVFPSTNLLVPLRGLLSADLKRWRQEKEEFQATIASGQSPDPASGARMSYAYRYGQNMLSLAQGRNADEADIDATAVSVEMTDAVIDVLREFLADFEFGGDAARVIATLRPDPVTEAAKSRQHMSFDLRVVPVRREFRRRQPTVAVGSVAKQLIGIINGLRSDNSREPLALMIDLANAAVRMGCGDDLDSITELIVARGSSETVRKHMIVRLLFGHDVDGRAAENYLAQLDARRDERRWEYDQNWFMWEELLILMIFGGRPLEAARRLLTYDCRGRRHDERNILEALGLSGHTDALMALDILRDRCMEQHMPDEWCSAVYEIGSADAGDRLLTMLFELPEERGAYRDRNIGMMVARLAEKHADLQARILRIAAVSDQCHMKGIATVVRNIQNENFLSRILDIPAKSLKSLSPAIAEALRELCVVHRPMEGSNGMSEIVPHSVQTLRAKLFARASDNSPGAEECGQLLQFIDDMRDDYGEPAEEARHPDISIGQPWPPAAKHAWAASAQLLQRTDR
jgi:hypothetical protein